MADIIARVKEIIAIAERSRGNAQYIELCFAGYAEPGYDEPESGIIALGNWNDDDRYDHATRERSVVSDYPSRIAALFEQLGVAIEWSDEWCSCSDCGKLIRTNPDSYSWTPSYSEGDGELLCVECLENDPEEHLESLEGNSDKANTIDSIDPTDHGYVKVNEESYESGHYGVNDDPSKIAKELEAKGIKRYLFNIDDVGQFDGKWSVFVHKSEASKLKPQEQIVDLPILMSEDEYREHVDNDDGICLACGEIRYGGCEPDAEEIECECCEQTKVMGFENALLHGHIEFEDE